MNSFSVAFTESDLFGKGIILSLVFVSISCWYVLSFKLWQAKKVQKVSEAVAKVIKKHEQDLLSLETNHLPKTPSAKIPNPFSSIFFDIKDRTIETLNKKLYFLKQNPPSSQSTETSIYLSTTDLELIEASAYTTISSQYKILEKDIFILSTAVTLAPFLGLLGTVWGILVTFAELQTGASASSNSAIIGGLSTALVTTVMGLVIAIPALIAYNYLKNSLKTYTSDMEDFVHSLLSTIEMQYRKVDIT